MLYQLKLIKENNLQAELCIICIHCTGLTFRTAFDRKRCDSVFANSLCQKCERAE